MHLGLSTYTFPYHVEILTKAAPEGFSFADMLQFAYANKIKYFQFGDNYPLHLLTGTALDDLGRLAKQKNIHLQVGTRGLFFENICSYISIAQKLESEFLRVVIDDGNYHPPVEEVIRIIKELLPVLKQSCITLAIENHDRFKAKTLVRIIEATDPELIAICLDTANSLGAGEGIAEIAPVLLPYTVNLHVKDFTIARVNHKMGFTVSGAPAGEGMLDIAWLMSECSKYKRCATVTLETWMNRESTDEQTLAKEMDWINKSIKYLNNYTQ